MIKKKILSIKERLLTKHQLVVHSPTPWRKIPHHLYIADANGRRILSTVVDGDTSIEEDRANILRAVASVNACANLKDPSKRKPHCWACVTNDERQLVVYILERESEARERIKPATDLGHLKVIPLFTD